jgi:hypothetical protein
MALRCEKSLLNSCKKEVIEQCVYCHKHFCIKHGHMDKAVCKNRSCMKKYTRDRAIADREAWEEEQKHIGLDKNTQGMCGVTDCQSSIYIPCGHCDVQFCATHVTRYNFSFTTHTRRTKTRVKGSILLCHTCKPHLKEYQKDRYE